MSHVRLLVTIAVMAGASLFVPPVQNAVVDTAANVAHQVSVQVDTLSAPIQARGNARTGANASARANDNANAQAPAPARNQNNAAISATTNTTANTAANATTQTTTSANTQTTANADAKVNANVQANANTNTNARVNANAQANANTNARVNANAQAQNKVAAEIAAKFKVSVSDVIELHNAGWRAEDIARLYTLAQLSGQTAAKIKTMRANGMTWDAIELRLHLPPGSAEVSLDSILSLDAAGQ